MGIPSFSLAKAQIAAEDALAVVRRDGVWRRSGNGRFLAVEEDGVTIRDSFVLPDDYLARVTGAHDRAWLHEGLHRLANEQVLCNAMNGDRIVGKQVRTSLIRWSQETPCAFSFCPILDHHILWPRQYAHVELAVVAALRSKYAAALYPLLCSVAGRAFAMYWRADLEPAWLMRVMGHEGPFGSFQRDALKPALRDIAQNGRPDRFRLPDEPRVLIRRDAGRGRKITALGIPMSIRHDVVCDPRRIRPEIWRRMVATHFVYETTPEPGDVDIHTSWSDEEFTDLLASVEDTLGPWEETPAEAAEKAITHQAPSLERMYPQTAPDPFDDDEAPGAEDAWYFDELADLWEARPR